MAAEDHKLDTEEPLRGHSAALKGGLTLVGLILVGVVGWFVLREQPKPPPPPPTPEVRQASASFTAIVGSVKVKPVGSVEWLDADLEVVLNKNDLVRTAGDATADIRFFDGTVVHVRPDSLITIEESA
jgi:hypothetical protein